MKKFVLTAVATLGLVSFAMAEDITLLISSISEDGTSVKGKTFTAGGKGEEMTVKIGKNAKVFKGKFDFEAKGFVPDGDDLKLAYLKSAIQQAQNGTVTVEGKALADTDRLELTIKAGKPAAKLNGTEVDFSKVAVKGKSAVFAVLTTGDDGVANTVVIGGFGGGFGKKGGK